ncbi:MAG: hypothetical protein JNL83_21655 [Myxococcales bacterium]|nr:hypothetical protein [Myxococcales bacterium]
MKHLASLALVLACACSGSSTSSPGPASGSSSPTPPSPPPPDPTTEPGAGQLDITKLGQPCGEGGTCSPGTECVKYYGIAGPRGPQFSSCEIPCGDKTACPTGTHCATVADGPGAVCRPH